MIFTMKCIYFTLLFIYINVFSQDTTTTLYLLTNKIKGVGYGFAINSEDKRFMTDYYMFNLKKVKGFSKKNNFDFEYYTLDEIRKEISIDTIKYKTIKEFTENKTPWKIHNELSLKRKIYLIEKRKIKSNKPYFEYKYYVVPSIYEGTRKNVVPTDLSFQYR